MEVPDALLEVLKCCSCDAYLSRGPVFLQHDGAAACSRCLSAERPATRNTQYEATAKLLKFPCKYRELGCTESVPYVEDTAEIPHEVDCEFREFVCPVMGSAHCDWSGPRDLILAHCLATHSERVLDNPAKLKHDISKPSVQTFLLRAFELLFLLHTKICLTSAKIFYSVRHLGGSDEAASKFIYTLDIKRGGEQLKKTGQVAPQGCMVIQEDSSLVVDTNSLLIMLGGIDGAVFTVAVRRGGEKRSCDGCGAELHQDDIDCRRCAPTWKLCVNKALGCTYKDLAKKCKKHEWFFCRQRRKCEICHDSVAQGSLFSHYVSAHANRTYKTGSTWRAKRTGPDGEHCLLLSEVGTAVCAYWMDDDEFELWAWSQVASEELGEFHCELRLTNPTTGHTQAFTTDVLYHIAPDWQFKVYKGSLWNGYVDVCINISKINVYSEMQ